MLSTDSKNILFVVTSHSELGTTGKKTGYWISEIAHPYLILSKKYNIIFASPKGGKAPIDEGSLVAHAEDEQCIQFLAEYPSGLTNTLKLEDVKDTKFDAIFYPGGHGIYPSNLGPMFDLLDNELSHSLCRRVYEEGHPVAALCHGPAGIANVKLSDGSYLVNGKKVTGFSNSEEDAVKLSEFMPFMLEDKLVANGAIYEKTTDWGVKVVQDGLLVTGQNPASAEYVAFALDKIITGNA